MRNNMLLVLYLWFFSVLLLLIPGDYTWKGVLSAYNNQCTIIPNIPRGGYLDMLYV